MRWQMPISRPKASTRPDSSSTLALNRRLASRAALAIDRDSGVHAVALHGSRRYREHSGIPPEQFASFRLRSAEDSARSSISRFNPSWRSLPGIFENRFEWCIRAPNPSFRPPNGIPHACDCARAHPRRQTARTRFCRRLQYWGLFLVGTNCRGAGSGACLRSLLCAALQGDDPRRAHQPGSGRSVPRLWSAANGDRSGAAL